MPKWERISEVKSTFSMTFHPPLISIVVVFFFVFFFLVTVVLLFCSLQPFWLIVWVVWLVSFQSFSFAVLGFNWYPIWQIFYLKHYIYLLFHNAYDLGKELKIRSEKLSTCSFSRTTWSWRGYQSGRLP